MHIVRLKVNHAHFDSPRHDSSVNHASFFFKVNSFLAWRSLTTIAYMLPFHKTELKVSSIQLICLIDLLVVVLIGVVYTHMTIIPLYICIIDQS